MDAHLAVELFDRDAVLENLLDPGLLFEQLLEFGRLLDRLRKRHFRVVGNELGDHVAFGGGAPQNARDVLHDSLRLQRAIRADLRHTVLAVLLDHVVDDFLAVAFTEIRVEVGRRHAVRVQKALEQQIVFHRVDVRDAAQVGDDGACAGAAPRANRDAVLLRPVDEVPHAEEVARVFGAADDRQLEVHAFEVAFRLLLLILRRVERVVAVFLFVAAHAVRTARPVQADAAEVGGGLLHDDAAFDEIGALVIGGKRSLRLFLVLRRDLLVDLLFGFGADGVQVERIDELLRRREFGVVVLVSDRDVALFGDRERVRNGIRGFRAEDLHHLVAGLEIKLIVFHPHPARVVHGSACLDAQHDLMGMSVLFLQVVHVVRRDQPDVVLARELDEAAVHGLLVLDPVIHDLQAEVLLAAEEVEVFEQHLAAGVHAAAQDRHIDLALQARAHADDALVVFGEELAVDARLVVEPGHVRFGIELAEVVVADVVLRQEDQVEPLDVRDAGLFLQAAAGRDVRLAADDRLDAGLLHGVVEFIAAAHDAVIGDRDGLHAVFLRHRDQVDLALGVLFLQFRPRDGACAVQQAVVRMQVQMHEIRSHSSRFPDRLR